MIDLNIFIKSLKLTWVRRLLTSGDKPWINIFESLIGNRNLFYDFGSLHPKFKAKFKNPFWMDVLHVWQDFITCDNCEKVEDKLALPLWYNTEVTKNIPFIMDWYQKGIILIQDVVNPQTGLCYLQTEIQEKYNAKTIDFFTFHRMKTSINKYIQNLGNVHAPVILPFRPSLPPLIRNLIKNKKGIRTVYKILRSPATKLYYNTKWERDMGFPITEDTWKEIYKVCFQTINDNYLIWMQYKILNRILGCRYLLKQMKLTDSSVCVLCQEYDETLVHLLYDCRYVNPIWNDLGHWIFNNTGITLEIEKSNIIFGVLNNRLNRIPLNSLILVTKSYIFNCSKKNYRPNIIYLQQRLKDFFKEQRALSVIKNRETLFIKTWQNFRHILEE